MLHESLSKMEVGGSEAEKEVEGGKLIRVKQGHKSRNSEQRQTNSPLEPLERRREVLLTPVWTSELRNCMINLCYVTEFAVICDGSHGKLMYLLSESTSFQWTPKSQLSEGEMRLN